MINYKSNTLLPHLTSFSFRIAGSYGPDGAQTNICTPPFCLAILCIAALAPAARAQVSGSGIDTGLGVANDAATPKARTPVLTYGIDAGVGETDNVTLAPSDKVSQTIAITDLDFAVKEQSRLLEVNAKGTSAISITCKMPTAASSSADWTVPPA